MLNWRLYSFIYLLCSIPIYHHYFTESQCIVFQLYFLYGNVGIVSNYLSTGGTHYKKNYFHNQYRHSHNFLMLIDKAIMFFSEEYHGQIDTFELH